MFGPMRQVQVFHLGRRIQEQQALNQLLGVLHLVDRLFPDEVAEAVIAPVVSHFRVEEVPG